MLKACLPAALNWRLELYDNPAAVESGPCNEIELVNSE